TEPTGDSNSRVVARNVQPGTYLVEVFWFEVGGGDFGEFYVAKGVHETDAATGDWLLVGQGEPGTYPVPGVDENGWDVITTNPGTEAIASHADAFARLEGVTESTNHDFINFNDPGFGGPGSIPGDI